MKCKKYALGSSPRVHCCAGSAEKVEYALGYDENGCQCLVPVGKSNFYAFVQSHKDSCDLHTILSRLDPNQVNGMLSSASFEDIRSSDIWDMSTLPKNPGEMLNLMKVSQNLFDGLPADVREAFNFSHQKFFSEIGTQSFKQKIDYLEQLRSKNVPRETVVSTNPKPKEGE